jgi:heptosyltransferase-2
MAALPPAPAKTVAVLRFSALGDVILLGGALETLHTAWPQTRIIFATKQAFAPLMAHHPAVNTVVTQGADTSTRTLAGQLKAFSPDVVLDLHGRLHSRALAWMVGARRLVTWNKRPLQDTVLVKLRVRPYQARMHIAARYHAAVEELVGRELPRARLQHHLGPSDVEEARAVLKAAGVEDVSSLLGISPGANWETKRWPAERYAELARRSQMLGAHVVFTGSAAEAQLVGDIAHHVPGSVNLVGKLSLGQLAGFISLCRAFVANDSGPMHLARALGVPTLTFFGSTDPRQFDFAHHHAMFANVACSPCSLYGLRACPKNHFACMLDLHVDTAWRELRTLWEGPRPVWSLG